MKVNYDYKSEFYIKRNLENQKKKKGSSSRTGVDLFILEMPAKSTMVLFGSIPT